MIDTLRQAELARGLEFEYALVTVGSSHDRAPSDQIWKRGEILSLDSGGNYRGYIGDLCRMAVSGQPDSELADLLAEISELQKTARAIVRHGVRGGDVYAAVEPALAASPNAADIRFVAHGMGMVSHEAPRLSANGPIPYPADDVELSLESGMVLSIETTLLHDRRGFIKLEDTIAVTDEGFEAFGDGARGWNVASA